jgi:hypothetical protein
MQQKGLKTFILPKDENFQSKLFRSDSLIFLPNKKKLRRNFLKTQATKNGRKNVFVSIIDFLNENSAFCNLGRTTTTTLAS